MYSQQYNSETHVSLHLSRHQNELLRIYYLASTVLFQELSSAISNALRWNLEGDHEYRLYTKYAKMKLYDLFAESCLRGRYKE